ncbi:MAG: caspase family protein [Sphingomonadales bacterium]|nr:caspase family protein [Sphingomonadales bacterium]
MKMAAVVIGVNSVDGDLPKLKAAASGASSVAEWLERNGYAVTLFEDGSNKVERRAIFTRIGALISAANLERLVIYFAGHGFLRGPNDEFWILSHGPNDPAEAINVTASAAGARFCGIPQVIFISDACRVVPKTGVHSGVTAASIFPNIRPGRTGGDVDIFYATLPGDPSLEAGDAEAGQAHGLFTQALVDAHKSVPGSALLRIAGKDYVRSRWLKDVLADRVDRLAQEIALEYTQRPDLQLQTQDGYVAQNETPPVDAARPPRDGTFLELRPVAPVRKAAAGSGQTQSSGRPRPKVAARRRAPALPGPGAVQAEPPRFVRHEGLSADAQNSLAQRTDLISQAGSEQAGDDVPRCLGDTLTVIGQSKWQTIESKNGPTRVRQMAVQFSDGSGMLVPALQDFSCQIVRDDGKVLALAYTWQPYAEPELLPLRAEVLGAATLGLLSRGPAALRNFADRIRKLKRFDPSLGIVAALAYAAIGDFAGASSVRDYMRKDLGFDLFDAWLLGGAGRDYPVVPAVPLLSQTWSFLDVMDASLGHNLQALPRVPGFWSVFSDEAMQQLPGLDIPGMRWSEQYV